MTKPHDDNSKVMPPRAFPKGPHHDTFTSLDTIVTKRDPESAKFFARMRPKDFAKYDVETLMRFASQWEITASKATDTHFISDDEIHEVHVHPDDYSFAIGGLKFGRILDGKAVLQQLAWNGCGEACSTMLILDHRKPPNMQVFIEGNFSTGDLNISMLTNAGLRATSYDLVGLNDQDLGHRLEMLLQQNGPGILSLFTEIESHSVVLDAFSLEHDKARIRDPFHGWCVTISAAAILKRFPSKLIQVLGSK